jgi:N-ethylmaleimide reductase
VKGVETIDEGRAPVASKFLRQIFNGAIITAGGFDRAGAEAILAGGDADLVAFGRFFTSNPDLLERLRRDFPLTPYHREAFWGGDERWYSDFQPYRSTPGPRAVAPDALSNQSLKQEISMNKLLSPVTIGPVSLKHRVVMAPLTRSRAVQPGDLPGDLMLQYYTQRASDGGLIITEASPISARSRGWYGAPGFYSDEQVEGWKRVTKAVHAKGGRMFAQLWHTGRSAHVETTGGDTPVSASVDPSYWQDASHLVSTPSGWQQPSPHRAASTDDIAAIVEDYRRAAERAKAAGFDGVELHAANGYLIDQFLQDGSNKRTDIYGGSIENRGRLLLEVVEALASVWGGDRVAVRIGPSGRWNGMSDSDPQALFAYVAEALNRFGLAYLHIVEPRVRGNVVFAEGQAPVAAQHLRQIFKGTIVAAGGFEPDSAADIVAKGDADLVAFGRHFISNPDLPRRIAEGLPLSPYDRDTFYTFDAKGYTDYPAIDAIAA